MCWGITILMVAGAVMYATRDIWCSRTKEELSPYYGFAWWIVNTYRFTLMMILRMLLGVLVLGLVQEHFGCSVWMAVPMVWIGAGLQSLFCSAPPEDDDDDDDDGTPLPDVWEWLKAGWRVEPSPLPSF